MSLCWLCFSSRCAHPRASAGPPRSGGPWRTGWWGGSCSPPAAERSGWADPELLPSRRPPPAPAPEVTHYSLLLSAHTQNPPKMKLPDRKWVMCSQQHILSSVGTSAVLLEILSKDFFPQCWWSKVTKEAESRYFFLQSKMTEAIPASYMFLFPAQTSP